MKKYATVFREKSSFLFYKSSKLISEGCTLIKSWEVIRKKFQN